MLSNVVIMDESVQLKIERITSISHFFKDDEYSYDSLKNDYIWFSDLSAFNDPFDVMLKEEDLSFDSFSIESMVRFLQCNKGIEFNDSDNATRIQAFLIPEPTLRQLVEKNHDELINFIKSYIADFTSSKIDKKFQCFSHNADFDPLENKLMWSHYSTGMRGFAIEFNFDDVLDSMHELNNGDFQKYTLINYVDLGFNDYLRAHTEKDKPLFVEQLIFAKHSVWEYEQEVRIMSNVNKLKYDSACISKVIIGSRMADSNKEKVVNILKVKNMLDKLYIAEFNRNDFSIRLRKFCN